MLVWLSACSQAPRGHCDVYLACIEDVEPSILAAATGVYGEGGTCWKDPTTEDVCNTTCGGLVDDMQAVYPENRSCYPQAQVAAICPFEDGTWLNTSAVLDESESDCELRTDWEDYAQFTCTSVADAEFTLAGEADDGGFLTLECTVDTASGLSCEGTGNYTLEGTVLDESQGFEGTLLYDSLSCEAVWDYSAVPD